MSVVNKFYSLSFDLTEPLSSGITFNDMQEHFRKQEYNYCLGEGLAFYVDTSSHSIAYKPVVYYSDSQTLLTKENFISEVSSLMLPSQHWFYAVCLSSNMSMHDKTSPYLEFNQVKDTSMFHQQGSDYFLDQISNFNYDIVCTCYDLGWSTIDPSLNTDVGTFNYSNKEGSESIFRQPSWDWWEERESKNQVVNFKSSSSAYLATPEKGGFDSALEIVGSSFGSLTDILDHQLIGGFTIGAIIAIPLCLTLVVTLIRALKK